jgi:hypothetical protein
VEGAESVLRYCAWCNEYQGAIAGEGHQIRADLCEIDTTTICPACRDRLIAEEEKNLDSPRRRK